MILAALAALAGPVRAQALSEVFQADEALIARYYAWALEEVGAPPDLPMPNVVVGALPRTVKMAFSFPTAQDPRRELFITLSPRSVARASGAQRLEVLGELAHELSHYILLMAENGWDPRRARFVNQVHHHCDPTFKRLTGGMGPIIWQVYHSADAVRRIDHMVQLSCWRDGHIIGATHLR